MGINLRSESDEVVGHLDLVLVPFSPGLLLQLLLGLGVDWVLLSLEWEPHQQAVESVVGTVDVA